MRPDTRAFKYLQAGTLSARWALLSRKRQQYAAHLVRDYGTPVRIAIQQAYIFGPSAYAYDYRTGKSVCDQWPAPRRSTSSRTGEKTMSKRTYTPSLEELSRRYGERYFTVSLGKRHQPHAAALQYGTLEDIVHTMDATIYEVDPDADLAGYSATISIDGANLVTMRDCDSPDSAQTAPQPAGDRYEIRQVDAWHDGESWTYNESWHLGTFTTTGDPARAFRATLKRHGITFYRGRTVTEYDGDVYEIVDRATREPLFAAIPQEV